MSGSLKIVSLKGINLAAMDIGGSSDPYYVIQLCDDHGKSIGANVKGPVIKNNLNPVWTNLAHTFALPVSNATQLKIELWDHDFIGSDDFLGEYFMSLSDLKAGSSTISAAVVSRPGKSDPVRGSIEVGVDWAPTSAPLAATAAAATPAPGAETPTPFVSSFSFPPFDYLGFEAKRNAALDAYEALKAPRVAAWKKLSPEEKKQRIQELVDSAKPLGPSDYPAPDAFLPALAQQFLEYAPLESDQIFFYTMKEFGIDAKLPMPRPLYFYQVPVVSDNHPRWPAGWDWMHKATSRMGYSIGGEMKGPEHLWSLCDGSQRNYSFVELAKLVQVWCHAPVDVRAKYFFGRLDKNHSGFLETDEIAFGEAATLTEFAFVLTTVLKNGLNHVRAQSEPELPNSELMERREKMLAVFAKHYESIMDDAIKNLLALADKDGDGKLSLEEYQTLLEPETQAKLKVWYNALSKRCMDLFVKEGVLAPRSVDPYRTFDLF